MIFVNGAIAIEQLSTTKRVGWLKRFAVTLAILGRFAFLPLFVPPAGFMRYPAALLFDLQLYEKSVFFEILWIIATFERNN